MAPTGCSFAALVTTGCDRIEAFLGEDEAAEEEAFFEAAEVVRGNIRVAVEAAGGIEPVTTVEVKSKASGEILELAWTPATRSTRAPCSRASTNAS